MSNRVELLKEFQAWKTQAVTKELVLTLKKTLQDVQDAWADGAFTAPSSEGTAQKNAAALGKVQTIGDLLDSIESGGFIKGD